MGPALVPRKPTLPQEPRPASQPHHHPPSLNSKLVMSAPQMIPPTHAEPVRPALVPRRLMLPQEPRPASQPHHHPPSLTSKLVMSAPQMIPPTHAELVKPALVPRKLMPPQEPRPASQPHHHPASLKVISLPPVVSALHQVLMEPTHALLDTNATVPRKPMPLLVPRPAKLSPHHHHHHN